MINIKYNLIIVDDDIQELTSELINKNIHYELNEDNEILIEINSIEVIKKVIAAISTIIIDKKWNECIDEIFAEIFHMEYEDLSKNQKDEVDSIKHFKRLEILTKKTIQEFLLVPDNEYLNIKTFIMFNMDGFEEYLKDELKNINFQTIDNDSIKKQLTSIWEHRGIHVDNYKYLYVLKEDGYYQLFNKQKEEITFEYFLNEMGFSIDNVSSIRNENNKYLTMILNISVFFGTKTIYIDEENCKELADLLCSNSSFSGNKAQINLSTRNMILQMLDASRGY